MQRLCAVVLVASLSLPAAGGTFAIRPAPVELAPLAAPLASPPSLALEGVKPLQEIPKLDALPLSQIEAVQEPLAVEVRPEEARAWVPLASAQAADAARTPELAAAGFDGDNLPGEPAASEPALPSYLASPDAAHSAWIAGVVEAASRSKTGRAVLGRVARLAEDQGRPLMVVVAPIGNSGEYAFDHEIVTLDSKHAKSAPEDAAPVFIHELTHVLQLAQELPADAFEMELEAWLTQFRVSEELGFKPPRGSFHASAFRRFKNDLDRFIVWLKKEYSTNIAVVGSDVSEYETELEERQLKHHGELERLEKRLEKKRKIEERMRQTRQPEGLIAEFHLDEVAPLEEKVRQKIRDIGWVERDLALLRDPESRRRYQVYAARVLKRARLYRERLTAS